MEKKTQRNAITEGNLLGEMVRFSVPYLIACFLQNFYGLADLFIVGRFNDAASVTAVSVGSQMMHMLTVVIVGLAMGTTVSISYAVGAGKNKEAAKVIGNSILLFSTFAILLTILLMSSIRLILGVLQTPPEAMGEAVSYLRICFGGILFITAYNLISSIFRGLGDTRRPMIFVALAGILNIGLDLLFIGAFRMGAFGAALATVISQGVSVLIALLSLRRMHLALRLSKADATYSRPVMGKILSIGVPIALQDGFIQISFLVITMIANSRGVVIAASVGIVEKIISFLFLVPSAMLSTVSALAAQNAGAGYHERSRQVLRYGIRICLIFGICIFLVCQIVPGPVVSLFVHDEPEVVRYGAQYLMTYALDCIFAGVHFCFSGFFSAYDKSIYSFIHNLLSILLVRIPGALLASRYFPGTLYPMGLAAPMGSLLSCIICLFFYSRLRRQTD
ncbi:MAG: MATE family efflux transporter [Clostridia bacterium]|nr:MATE family efflux transporter [Clostridia bacterium]